MSVIAPATSANMGPGYDCLGIALDIWNRTDVLDEPLDNGEEHLVEVVGEGAGEVPTGRGNLVYRSMAYLFEQLGREMPPVWLRCHNQIPLERGLGSSASAIAGGLVAANAMCGNSLSKDDLLQMAAAIEGHPDNVAPAVMGGLQLVVQATDRLHTAYIRPMPGLSAILFIPEFRIATSAARAVIPDKVSMADAVHNVGRAALLVASMAVNRPEYLAMATQDRLHQPYREPLFPAMGPLLRAALEAGALGAFLSGSGSTVLALSNGMEENVASQMAKEANEAGVKGQTLITRPTNKGAHLVGS